MKSITIFLITVCPLILFGQNPLANADQKARQLVNKRQHKGLYMAIIKGDKIYEKGYGNISSKKRQAPDRNTIFEIGAVTQVFTTSVLLATEKQGKLKLEDSVKKYIPAAYTAPSYFPIKCYDSSIKIRTNPADPSGGFEYPITTCRPDPLGEEVCISLCDLATHSSGLSESPAGLFPWNPFKAIKQLKNPYAKYSEKDLYEHLKDYNINFAPGTRFKYSNTGMALLGSILSDIHQKPLERLVYEYIKWPLSLENTTFSIDASQRLKLAQGHNKRGRQSQNWDFDALAPALGLKSTPEDMIKFIKANIKSEHLFLNEVFASAHQPRLDISTAYQAKKNTTVGYGWMISPLSESKNYPIVWSSGQTGGYSCFVAFNKELNLGIVLMANSNHKLDKIGFDIINEFTPTTSTFSDVISE